MNATARDFNSQPADTSGLEDIFDLEDIQSSVDSHRDAQSNPSENQLILTAAEASAHLRIPLSTMYRRIRAGKFKTVEGQDGSVRIILAQSENQNTEVILSDSHHENQNSEVVLSDSHGENHFLCSSPNEFDKFVCLLNERDKKLEAASYRIGYLESQLEERDQAIKLLTDSQHRPGWLAKLSSWFFKGQ